VIHLFGNKYNAAPDLLIMLLIFCAVPALCLAEPDCQPEYRRGYEQAATDMGAVLPDIENVKKARERGEKIVFIVGDSIAHGSYFKQYTDSYPELKKVSRPDRLLNLIAKENSIKIYYQSITLNPFQLYWTIYRGDITSGDTVIIQDAGPHPDDLEIYRSTLLLYRYFVYLGNPDVKLLFTTTYDENPIIPNSQWDIPVDNGTSINTLIAETAGYNHKSLSNSSVILIATVLKKAKKLLAPYKVNLLFEDGIHLTLIGNVVFAKAIMEGLGHQGEFRYSDLLDALSGMKISLNGSDMSNIIRRPGQNIQRTEMDVILNKIFN